MRGNGLMCTVMPFKYKTRKIMMTLQKNSYISVIVQKHCMSPLLPICTHSFNLKKDKQKDRCTAHYNNSLEQTGGGNRPSTRLPTLKVSAERPLTKQLQNFFLFKRFKQIMKDNRDMYLLGLWTILPELCVNSFKAGLIE